MAGLDEISRSIGSLEAGVTGVVETLREHTSTLKRIESLGRETNGRVTRLELATKDHAELLSAHEEELEAIRTAQHDRAVIIKFVRSWKGAGALGVLGLTIIATLADNVQAIAERVR